MEPIRSRPPDTVGHVPPSGAIACSGEHQAMEQAMAAAAQVRCVVSPRPWVGAAVLDDHGAVLATGATQGRSGPHAEVMALRAAGERARGATLVVTLEPCSHQGRTPPCADAVIDAGIARVVVALRDPDPKVAGRGIARLQAAGCEVAVGLGAEAVAEQLAPYLVHRTTGRPMVVLKLASTLDGRTAAPDGTSQWITGAEARADAHRLRAQSDAVLVGAGTVRSDDPSLTVRLEAFTADPAFRQPQRVVLGSVPDGARVAPALSLRGDLGEVLDELGRREILQVLVEGGAGVAGDFHRQRLVDRYVCYVAPAIFGGDDALGLFRGSGAATMGDLWRGRITDVVRLGADLRVDIVPGSDQEAA